MPASGHQNHTTSPSASAPFVKGAIRVHRIPPRVRDDRDTPLSGTRRRGYSFDLGEAGTEMFLQMGLDRANQIDPVQQIPLCAHTVHPAGYGDFSNLLGSAIVKLTACARSSDRSAGIPHLCCGFAARRARKDNPEFGELAG